jgi:alkylmercury lyase
MDSDIASFATLSDSLVGTFPARDDAPLARALLRELARGEPVAPSALRHAGAEGQEALTAALARWPNVEVDETGRIVAFSGLSLTPTPHRFAVGGRQLYTWCAWDTLFLPALLDQPALVKSNCRVTGRNVRLTVEPSGVRETDPEPLLVSFPAPATTSTADITGSFCCHVHFLAGREAADQWLSQHAGGAALTLQDAFELGRIATRCFSD